MLVYKHGKAVREGAGLSFFYYGPSTVIVRVPIATSDEPFAFEDTSADYQSVTLQGQITYRVSDPKRLASLMDFSVDSYGRYVSDDPQKLSERLVSTTRVLCADRVHAMPLREILTAQKSISETVLAGLRQSPAVTMLGVEILGLSIVSIQPNPDTAKALEADARESLLRQADEAVYARRNAAVEQERRIREREMATELAVEEKKRQIEQKKMASRIESETQRTELVALNAENDRKQADTQAYALEVMLKPLRETDWHVLLAANASKIDPKQSIALAFRELAENAGKIGQLTLTPDLLSEFVKDGGRK